MRVFRLAALAIAVAGLVVVTELPLSAADPIASPNMELVGRFQWREGQQYGTDLEFATIGGRDYAFAGNYNQGLQIVDITNPRSPRRAGVFECGLAQGDVQVFQQGSRWLAAYATDDAYLNAGSCYNHLGVKPGSYGTFIADVTNPTRPRTLSHLDIPPGSHNVTVHPNGKFLYNSDNEALGEGLAQIWNISTPSAPVLVNTIKLLPDQPAGLERGSHDLTFSADGKRAYAAAVSSTVVLDTTNPASPVVLSRIYDRAIALHHQAEPVDIATLAGLRRLLVITDEQGGGASPVCPGGGLHVYDVTGSLELIPAKLGAYFAPSVGVTNNPLEVACTSHVLRMHPKERILTIGWYGLGSRVIDFSGLADVAAFVSAGVAEKDGSLGAGMREVGYLRFADSDTWAAKTNRIAPDGSFFLYANDYRRGLDVIRYTPPRSGMPSNIDPGEWLTPAEALARAEAVSGQATGSGSGPRPVPFCALPFQRT